MCKFCIVTGDVSMINKILDYMRYGKMNNNIISSDYIEFKEDKVAEAWGNKYYQEWSKHYKDSMRVAKEVVKRSCMNSSLEFYCGYSHRQINEYLRFDTEDYLYGEMSDILAITLSMAPRVPNNIIVYRLVCDQFINQLIENNKEGIPVQEKGFISTSITKNIVNAGEPYCNHSSMLKIYVKENTVGIYVNGVARRPEQELLLYPNGFFRLLKNPYEDNNKKIYECELFYL